MKYKMLDTAGAGFCQHELGNKYVKLSDTA